MNRPLVLFLFAACAFPARALQAPQGDPVPWAPEAVVNVDVSYQDEWANVSMQPDGSRYMVSWNDSPGTPILARFFTGEGLPLTGDVLVNAFFNGGSQDEAMSAADAFGNVFVCWTDRGNIFPANDGDGMGTFGRVFTMDGVPLGPDFVLNSTFVNSQWEPMPAALPGGGWVVAFNGDNDGDAYLRFFELDGTPVTNDIQFNTFDNNGQTEAEVRALPDGTVMAVFADFGGNVFPFNGTNLFGRRYDVQGHALDAAVFPLHPSTVAFDQLEPRMANSDSAFIVVWEDRGNDGSGAGVYARRFAASGAALETEFRVNLTTTGNQSLPEVASDAAGHFVVCWEDWSTGVGQIRARSYDSDGQPVSPGFLVSGNPAGTYRRPTVALSADGSSVVFAYGGPGITGGTNSEDIYVRRYAWSFERPAPPVKPSRPGLRPAPGGPPAAPQSPVVSPTLN